MESRENFLLAIRSIFPGGGILNIPNMLKLLGFSPDLTCASAFDSFMIHKSLMVLWNIWVSVVQLAGVMFPKPWAL